MSLGRRATAIVAVAAVLGVLAAIAIVKRDAISRTACEIIGVEFATCDPVLSGQDVRQGRLLLEGYLFETNQQAVIVGYWFTNMTGEERTFAWPKVSARGSDGNRWECRGDDSIERFYAPPGERVKPLAACYGSAADASVDLYYDGVFADTIDLRGE